MQGYTARSPEDANCDIDGVSPGYFRTLGARPAQVLRLVMKEVGVLALIGLVVGMPAAIVLARLSGQDERNADVFLAASLVVLLVAALAGWIPAYRASRIDPKEALRYE